MARNNLKVTLCIVDPNNDFMGNDDGSPYSVALADGTSFVASLPVKGGVSDCKRAAKLIDRVGHKLNDIKVTLDSHHTMHIGHPDMWVDGNGRPPAPYTQIRADDMKNGIWRARNPAHQKRMYNYLVQLESKPGNFVHTIWPPHCRIGTWGHNVQVDLEAALTRWERKNMGVVDYVTKGSAVWEEHFGALMAEVQDPNDPSTQLNTPVVRDLEESDLLGFLGWASSHCLKRTVEQVAENLGDDQLKKIVLITDCMSPVPAIPNVIDFPAIAAQFLSDMQARGMKLMTSEEFLA